MRVLVKWENYREPEWRFKDNTMVKKHTMSLWRICMKLDRERRKKQLKKRLR